MTCNPTKDQRRTVHAMAGFGVPHDQIAAFLEIDPKTLRKRFRVELDRGMIEANVKVAQTLFNLATAERNVAAAIFWMKARAGWREKIDTTHRLLGSEGDPVQMIDIEPPISALIAGWTGERVKEGEDVDR